MDISVRGLYNVPEKGPAILIANHPSTIDVFLIMSIINRKIYAFGKADFFIKPFNKWFLRSLGGIPVKNEKYNRHSLEEAEMLLHKNQIILIFPEGQVNSGTSLLPFKKSFLKLASKLKVPIVPIIIYRAS